MRNNRSRFAMFLVAVSSPLGWMTCSDSVLGQVVQLPTMNTFSINTSVMAPDSGAGYLGGNRSYASGSYGRGPLQIGPNYGARGAGGGVSVHATVIDLDELDRMIRSQANTSPSNANLSVANSKVSKYRVSNKAAPSRTPDYAYMMQLSSPESKPDEASLDDARYYLSLAEVARQRGHWASVELYYKLAWKSLPEKRQEAARDSLAKSRTQAASAEPADVSKTRKR